MTDAAPGGRRLAEREPEPATAAPGGWRQAVVRAVDHPGPRAVALRLEVPERVPQLAGQHYVVRLRAEDGYTAQRSYSVASAPSDPLVELYVERLDDGEVSGYLADVVRPGDELEVRGPIGGWFVWHGDTPAVAVGAGSGVVPFVAMLRHAVALGRTGLLRLAVTARSPAELPYRQELEAVGALVAYTREGVRDGRPAGRLAERDYASLVVEGATYYVCGSPRFAEAASSALVALGVPAPAIRVERFGPTG